MRYFAVVILLLLSGCSKKESSVTASELIAVFDAAENGSDYQTLLTDMGYKPLKSKSVQNFYKPSESYSDGGTVVTLYKEGGRSGTLSIRTESLETYKRVLKQLMHFKKSLRLSTDERRYLLQHFYSISISNKHRVY
ncbi:MAG: hypothetical protein K0S09_1885 [Sphingobacteriaceae bacterium]|jgi:hypothetical protein|nr:hypothetical protein [Sphingobacteriaceae bacterium]